MGAELFGYDSYEKRYHETNDAAAGRHNKESAVGGFYANRIVGSDSNYRGSRWAAPAGRSIGS